LRMTIKVDARGDGRAALERFAIACTGSSGRELFTRASFLIGQSRKQGD
jgi:hypothetical protein